MKAETYEFRDWRLIGPRLRCGCFWPEMARCSHPQDKTPQHPRRKPPAWTPEYFRTLN